MPITVIVRPSGRLRTLVGAFPSVNAAARAFGLDNVTLYRFMRGKGGLSSEAAASIMESTKLPYNVLFEHEEQG